MPPVDLIVEAGGWDETALAGLADEAAAAVLGHLGLDPAAYEIALLACDDVRIAGLNAEFRGKAQPTNVLSWPAEDLAAETPGDPPALADAPPELGDIALAYETCRREAEAAGKPFEDHLRHLVIHGVLHLLGYDHIDDADAALMEAAEIAILGEMGIADPYLIGDPAEADDGT